MMPTIPYGGFLACRASDSDQKVKIILKLESDLLEELIVFQSSDVVLAAWSQFSGQGLWSNRDSAVAYDTDLTNLTKLCQLLGIPDDSSVNIGLLLWTLYQKYGRSFVDRLRGAFAFAIWDGHSCELLVFTDYYGIRPVVYTRQSYHFAAASRIRQLELVGINKEINPEAIYHYLFFQAICRLPFLLH